MRSRPGAVQREVDEWFAAHAPAWDAVYWGDTVAARIYQRRQELALSWVDRLGLSAGSSVLEVGCGAGHASIALARKGFHVTATDPGPAMLALTSALADRAKVGERLSLVRADAHALGFDESVFHLVLALGVLPWLDSPSSALREIARVLRPGGFLIASADNRLRLPYLVDPRLNPFLAPVRQALRRLRSAPPQTGGPPQVHSPRELDALLRGAGFETLASRTCGFGPFTLFGHAVAEGSVATGIDTSLQRLADAGVPLLRLSGSHYLALSSRRILLP